LRRISKHGSKDFACDRCRIFWSHAWFSPYYSVRAYLSHQRRRRGTLRGFAAACLSVMSQSAQRCPSISLLKFADYVGVLFGAKGRQRTITELIGSRSLTERSSKLGSLPIDLAAVYGALSQRRGQRAFKRCRDSVRGMTSKTLEGSFWP